MVREFLAVVVSAALQWALASLLLANGAAFCLIAATASSLGLGQPCLLCARVHHLLCSSSADVGSSQGYDAVRRLLCEAHVAAVVATSARSEPEQRLEKTCAASDHVERGTKDDSEKPGGLEAHRVVSIGSEICEQDHGGDHGQPRPTNRSNVEATASIENRDGDGDGPYVSLFELAPIVALPEDNPDRVTELDEIMPELKHESVSSEVAAGGERLTVSRLVSALRAQRRELEAMRAELEAERRAKADAAECQRELEEQSEFDREAVRLAMQLVHETETEKHGLQRQLDACRAKAQLYESAMVTALPPVNQLGNQLSRRGDDGDVMGQEDGGAGRHEGNWSNSDNNYQSLVDFLPGSVYSSSPDLTNLLKLYTEGNGAARRPSDSLTDASAVAAVAEEVEEEVVAVTVAAVSDSNGGNGETSSTAGASLPESGSNQVEAATS